MYIIAGAGALLLLDRVVAAASRDGRGLIDRVVGSFRGNGSMTLANGARVSGAQTVRPS